LQSGDRSPVCRTCGAVRAELEVQGGVGEAFETDVGSGSGWVGGGAFELSGEGDGAGDGGVVFLGEKVGEGGASLGDEDVFAGAIVVEVDVEVVGREGNGADLNRARGGIVICADPTLHKGAVGIGGGVAVAPLFIDVPGDVGGFGGTGIVLEIGKGAGVSAGIVPVGLRNDTSRVIGAKAGIVPTAAEVYAERVG
jgi:hypothetical protein